jgi:hypothetical protein
MNSPSAEDVDAAVKKVPERGLNSATAADSVLAAEVGGGFIANDDNR